MAAEIARYWQHTAVAGVDLLRARFITHRYGRHAHETYTFGIIESGVEEFDYGGQVLRAGPGALALLDPEVVHTGHAATSAGWSYRVLYPEVSVVTDVAEQLGWRGGTPRFPQTVLYDAHGAALLRSAHQAAEHGDQLASSSLLTTALAGLLPRTPGSAPPGRPGRGSVARQHARHRRPARGPADRPARARGTGRDDGAEPVRAAARVPGGDRAAAARVPEPAAGPAGQGTPRPGQTPADVAFETGFADQAHLTRHFKRVVGVPPGAYQRERLLVA